MYIRYPTRNKKNSIPIGDGTGTQMVLIKEARMGTETTYLSPSLSHIDLISSFEIFNYVDAFFIF